MDVKFSDYRFSRDQHILYKHEDIIELKRNQALLLDFFLSNPEGIHSKEAIMDFVWQNKVVSEQVVFQTISQLRAIFGADAIKTFPKKGYKWQLSICQQAQAIEAKPEIESPTAIRSKPSYLLWLASAASILLIIGLTVFFTSHKQVQVQLHLSAQSKATNTENQVAEQLDNLAHFSIKAAPALHTNTQLFAAPKLAWQQANIPTADWLLWFDNFSSAKGHFIHYGLSKADIHWQGYIYGETQEQLASNFAKRLEQLSHLALFSANTKALDISTLTLMKQTVENDPDVLLLLANYYLEVKQYDVAIAYTQKLTNLHHSYAFIPYQAKAKWLLAEIYKKRRKYQLAQNSLAAMAEILTDTPLWVLQYENISAQAWIAYNQHDFETMFATLDKAIKFGQQQGDALTLFELHILYSILAKKGGDDHKKYAHLNEAQALLLKHQLDDSNFAVVYYHFAIFTQDNDKALPYLQKIIELPRTIRNGWIIDHSTEMLVDQYIEQKQYQAAIALLEQQANSPKYFISKARIYHAQAQMQKAHSYFEKAFEQARLEYKVHIAIDAALMLYQLTADQPEVQAEYLAYLQRNTNNKWLSKQMETIASKP